MEKEKKHIDADELAKAVEEAQTDTPEDDSLFTVTFRKPVLYNGQQYKSLTFDFDSLTGGDGLSIEAELQANGRMPIVPAFSGEYLIRMAAKACTEPIGHDIFSVMPLREYNSIRSAARNFLLRTE